MATETLRPDGDVSVGDWVVAPLFSKINDQSDGSSISASDVSPADCTVSLPTASKVKSGNMTGYTLRVRAKRVAGFENFEAELTDGIGPLSDLLAPVITDSFAWYEVADLAVAFTTQELADLEVNLIAPTLLGEAVAISQVELVLTYTPVWAQDSEPAGSWVQD